MRRIHTCAHDRGEASRVRVDRQYERVAGHVLRGDPTHARRHLYWFGQDLLWQAITGPGVWGAHRSDRGDFDDAMARVQEVSKELGIYLVNSINPFRLEGQKTIMFRVLEALQWEVPDWIVVPGGNLGNSSAFGKAFIELKSLGLIDRLPRLAVINAAGADTLFELMEHRKLRWNDGRPDMSIAHSYYRELDERKAKADTIASAIEINRPVNLKKCLRALEACDGVVRKVTDQEILDAKAQVGAGGIGCEPASAASVAGARLLKDQGIILPSDRVVCILTGHQLKDPTATVAYHTTDQQKFNEVLEVAVSLVPPSPIER